MPNHRSTNVSRLLQRYGPSLTSDLARELQRTGISSSAARQQLSRLPEEVRILHGLPFPRKSRFLYLESQFGTKEYWDALIKSIERANPSYAAALAGVRARGGLVPKIHFSGASGAPIKQKGQLASEVVLNRLCSVDLLSVTTIHGIGDCVVLGGNRVVTSDELGSLRARLLTEEFLLDAIRGWLGRMNMASPHVTSIRDNDVAPKFATFNFDICGPSYLRPLVRFRNNKPNPGFLVADSILGRVLESEDVTPFIRKCSTLKYLRKVRPFLPMLIADGFSKDALRLCRSNGIIATRPDTLFGQDVARALGELLQTLSRAAANAVGSPGKIEELFRRLSAIEGAAGNLRGALFEVLVGHTVHAIEGGSIDIGALVRDPVSGRRAEVDVRLVRERTLKFYECKGHGPSSIVSEEEVGRWLTTKVPVIYSAHNGEERFHGCRMNFEFWTCGEFAPQAKATLNTAKRRTKKYGLDWKDGTSIKSFISELYSPGIKKILNEHYLKHPLA